MTGLSLAFDVQVVHFACLPPHSQTRNFNRLIVAIQKCNRLSLRKTGCEPICKSEIAIFDDVHRVMVVDGEASAIFKFNIE